MSAGSPIVEDIVVIEVLGVGVELQFKVGFAGMAIFFGRFSASGGRLTVRIDSFELNFRLVPELCRLPLPLPLPLPFPDTVLHRFSNKVLVFVMASHRK